VTLIRVSRRNAVIIVAVAVIVLVAGIALLWSRDDGGSTTAFCNTVRTGENPLDAFDRYDPSNADTAQLQHGIERLQQLERAAPAEIRPDVKVLVDVAQQLVKALDPATKDKAVPDFTSQLDRVRGASANVTRFASDECGVTLDSGASSSPESLTTPG
jgi:hypothetical protein